MGTHRAREDRTREDRYSRNSDDHNSSNRHLSKNEHLMRDLKHKIKELGWSYEKANSAAVEFSPIKKQVLGLYREIVLNDPELSFQEKVFNSVSQFILN